MRYLIIFLLAIGLMACSTSEVNRLTAENLNLQEQLIECRKETERETARADAAENEINKALEDAMLANVRAQKSAEMALEVIERVKKRK